MLDWIWNWMNEEHEQRRLTHQSTINSVRCWCLAVRWRLDSPVMVGIVNISRCSWWTNVSHHNTHTHTDRHMQRGNRVFSIDFDFWTRHAKISHIVTGCANHMKVGWIYWLVGGLLIYVYCGGMCEMWNLREKHICAEQALRIDLLSSLKLWWRRQYWLTRIHTQFPCHYSSLNIILVYQSN